MRLDEGHGPGRQEQTGRQMGGGIVRVSPYAFGERHRYDLRDLVADRPRPSLEGFAALDRLDVALAPGREFDVRALFRNEPMMIGDKPIARGDADVSLYELMQDGMGLLLDASPDGKASRLVAAKTQRIRCVAVGTGPSMLVRPDACLAWAGEGNGTDGLEDALRRWFIPTSNTGNMPPFEPGGSQGEAFHH